MEKKRIEIHLVNTWSEDEIVLLYKAAGWWKDTYDATGIPPLIAGSFAFAVAVEKKTGKAVGMGRVLSDGISDAYIQDVVVLQPYRGQSLGKKIVQTLIDYCVSKGIQWLGLIAEPGSSQFYTSLGFKPMDQYVPMLYAKER
ncbi:MAG TPA: N-acetyltransferase [Thermoplasmata archaeon]|jgi:aralkylamine N-acetyltransferase|nr:MAG TPA: N-acetyltransferase [Thermoplasmata archaeon]